MSTLSPPPSSVRQNSANVCKGADANLYWRDVTGFSTQTATLLDPPKPRAAQVTFYVTYVVFIATMTCSQMQAAGFFAK